MTVELATSEQIAECAPVCSRMTGTYLQGAAVLEHEPNHLMAGNRRSPHADQRHRHDRAIVDGIHQIADSQLSYRSLAERCRDRRVGGRANRTEI